MFAVGLEQLALLLAHRVGMAVDIEMNASAVADANRNGIKNCRFVCSKAEDVMGSLLKDYLTKNQDESNDADIGNKEEISTSEDVKDEPEGIKEDIKIHYFDNIVAIVDPPRVGLHPTVTRALRAHSGLKRLVYISCNPEGLMANAIELCTPSSDKREQ